MTSFKIGHFMAANKDVVDKLNNTQQMIHNEELDKAITHFYESQTDINRQIFLQKLLTSQVLAPINISDASINNNNELVIPKASDVSLMMLQNENGDIYCPVFTNETELNKLTQQKSGTLKQSFVKLATNLVDKLKDNDGIVINPFGASITLNKALIKSMLNVAGNVEVARTYTIESGTKVLIGNPKVYPAKIVDIMTNVLKNHHCVNNAWLRLMERPDKGLSYLIIVESDDEDVTHLFTDMAKLCKPYVNNIPQDFIKYNKESSFITNAIKGCKPFYKKHKKFLGIF